jgi:DNA-binding PadR family transcriptional regulator
VELSDGAAPVLVSLAGGPQHPAAVIEDVAATAGRTLAVGTLYSVLDRLIGQGLAGLSDSLDEFPRHLVLPQP